MWELDHKESWVPKYWCFWTVVLEKTFESSVAFKEIQSVHPKGNQSWVLIGRTDVEAETLILWPPDAKSRLIGKDPDAGKDWRQEKGMTEDEKDAWRPAVHGVKRVRHDWVTELNWSCIFRQWVCFLPLVIIILLIWWNEAETKSLRPEHWPAVGVCFGFSEGKTWTSVVNIQKEGVQWMNDDQRLLHHSVQFSSVAQSCPILCDPMTSACQASLSITNCQSLPEPMSIESVSILGTYWPGEFIFQCPIVLPFHTVHRVLKARILKCSVTNSRRLLKLMSIESVKPSNHLILCRPLLLPPSIFPNIRVFSNESALRIRWPKY